MPSKRHKLNGMSSDAVLSFIKIYVYCFAEDIKSFSPSSTPEYALICSAKRALIFHGFESAKVTGSKYYLL